MLNYSACYSVSFVSWRLVQRDSCCKATIVTFATLITKDRLTISLRLFLWNITVEFETSHRLPTKNDRQGIQQSYDHMGGSTKDLWFGMLGEVWSWWCNGINSIMLCSLVQINSSGQKALHTESMTEWISECVVRPYDSLKNVQQTVATIQKLDDFFLKANPKAQF